MPPAPTCCAPSAARRMLCRTIAGHSSSRPPTPSGGSSSVELGCSCWVRRTKGIRPGNDAGVRLLLSFWRTDLGEDLVAVANQWRDDPIQGALDDRLARVDLARRVATLVTETYSPDSSVVHGLVGPWGSGKSSVLALTQLELEALDEEWAIVRFSPWATSDLNSLLAEFHGAIVEALPDSKSLTEFKRGLGEVMNAASPIAAIAGALIGLSGTGELLKKADELLRREKSWIAKFNDASKELKKLNIKVLVIADDIDRLHGDELLNFLKLVRLVGRFPGMSYLIAYDEAGLLASIQSAGSAVDDADRAQDFLEKFVQYPVYLPPLIESQILDLLNDAIGPAVSSSRHTYSNSSGRLSFAHAWTALLDTPRAINRFAAQLRLVLPLHQPGEVDLVDVMLLTLIRLHAPKVFDAISRRKELLTEERSSKQAFNWEAIIGDRVSPEAAPAIQELVERLFPATRTKPGASTPAPGASNPDYFDRYFLQGIPGHDIADQTIHSVVARANEGDVQPLEELLRGGKSEAQRAAISSKIQRFSNWGLHAGDTPVVAFRTVVGQLHRLPKRSSSLLPSAYDNARRWVCDMLVRLPLDVTVSEVREALAGCRDEKDRNLMLESIVWQSEVTPPPGVKALATEQALISLDDAIANTRQGDSAELLGSIERWTLLARTFAQAETRDRLARELEDGMSADDLAARFVSIAHWSRGNSEQGARIDGMLWDAFSELLPDGLQTSPPSGANFDADDISWASRKAYGLGELAKRQGLAE